MCEQCRWEGRHRWCSILVRRLSIHACRHRVGSCRVAGVAGLQVLAVCGLQLQAVCGLQLQESTWSLVTVWSQSVCARLHAHEQQKNIKQLQSFIAHATEHMQHQCYHYLSNTQVRWWCLLIICDLNNLILHIHTRTACFRCSMTSHKRPESGKHA